MFNLLNRFAWIISITIAITIIAIDLDFFLPGIIVGIIVKFLFLSNSFIKNRLEFFANSIKENYLNEKDIDTSSEKKKINTEEKKEIVNLEEIEIQENIDEINNINIEKEKEVIEKKAKIADMQNNKNYTKESYEPNAFDIFFEKTGTYIKDFFSTNLLAKLGSILVFLAVVYFLKGVIGNFWEVIGPVGRITLGIIIGFITYFIGISIYNNYRNEGLILMGTGILINFAVILSGRYLVGDNGYLSEGTTFLFLILNTVFSVLTSLIYKSNTLLIFSFIFAYLNPFIIGTENNGQPYTLVGYSLIVSLGALYLSTRQTNIILLIISFIAGNLLFLVAPFSDSIGWSAKIILTSILSLITIILANKFKGINHNISKNIFNVFIGTYIFVILHLLNSSINLNGNSINVLSETIGFIVYNLIILSLFVFSIKIVNSLIISFDKENKTNNSSFFNLILFFPLIILIVILFSSNLIFIPFVLIGTIITYLVGFIFLQDKLSNLFSYIFFGVLAIFILFFNIDIAYNMSNISTTEFITIMITSFIFLFSNYYYSAKENLGKLFSIGTIGTILIISPIIKNSGELMNYSIITIIIFAISNWILPFINKNIQEKNNLTNLLIGSIVGALFLAFQIYNFGEKYFHGIIEGFAFLALAVSYLIQGFIIINKIGIEKVNNSENLKNIFYSYAGISISLFSVAIAFVFANHPEIISTTWLFEATILYFFYGKNGNNKILGAAMILFMIGLTKFGILIDVVQKGEYLFLISFIVIFSSFILNLNFLNKSKEKFLTNIHNIFHIIGMIIMSLLLLKIIPNTGYGWNTLAISIFTLILGSFYAKFNFTFLKKIFILVLIGVGILHIGSIEYIFWNLQKDNLEYLKIMQYFVSAIIIANIFVWNKLNTEEKSNKTITIILSIYIFIISNIYIIDLFENIFGSFTLTIYWGLIASALLIYGIQKNIIKYRTIGLYFLTLTSTKIFLYDVWQIGNTNSRVAVFLILGIIFIIISTLYTKRFGNNLLGEFSLENLKDKKIGIPSYSKEKNIEKKQNTELDENKKIKKENFIINNKIENIDISNIKSVQFIFSNKNINIRAINLIKISKLIIEQLDGKTDFKTGELKDIYEYVKENYKSDLPKNNYDKILLILEKFVKEGGKVKLIPKD